MGRDPANSLIPKAGSSGLVLIPEIKDNIRIKVQGEGLQSLPKGVELVQHPGDGVEEILLQAVLPSQASSQVLISIKVGLLNSASLPLYHRWISSFFR